MYKWKDLIKALREVTLTKNALSNITEYMQRSENGKVSSKSCKFVKKVFSVSNFFKHILNMSVIYLQSIERIHWKLCEKLFPKVYTISHNMNIVRITKRRNSYNTDLSAPLSLPHLHYLMVMIWCKFDQHMTKAIKVTKQNPQMLTERQKDGKVEGQTCWKSIPA